MNDENDSDGNDTYWLATITAIYQIVGYDGTA